MGERTSVNIFHGNYEMPIATRLFGVTFLGVIEPIKFVTLVQVYYSIGDVVFSKDYRKPSNRTPSPP